MGLVRFRFRVGVRGGVRVMVRVKVRHTTWTLHPVPVRGKGLGFRD